MSDLGTEREPSPVLIEIPRFKPRIEEPVSPASQRGTPGLNILLFVLTLLTTTMAGTYAAGGILSLSDPVGSIANLAMGLSFSIPLMAILLAHEMGHYIVARYHNVDASAPYFIPAPFPSVFIIGTFGAFIRMRSMPRTRRVMFDIGAAGPWAGMIVALPAVYFGLKLSQVEPLSLSQGGLSFGNSLLFLGLVKWVLGVNPNSVNITLHPLAFAGWIGFFVTTLNLLPVGQLDGGHVVYALFGRHHRTISRLFVLSCVLMVIVPLVLGLNFWGGWLLWAILLLVLGLGHPATVDAEQPLDRRRTIFAWATVALFVLTFAPVPVSLAPPAARPEKVYQVRYDGAASHRFLAADAAGSQASDRLQRLQRLASAATGLPL